jgi:3'5'-cyclic nucleotide phosphodiesterase
VLLIEILKKFIVAVKVHYHSNAYHNIYHAVDVLQATYFLIYENGHRDEPCAYASFTALEKLAMLIAAYGHDIGHPGCNNFFLNNAKTSLSVLYHGESVLEHYHISLLFQLLERHPIFGSLPSDSIKGITITDNHQGAHFLILSSC